jgi:hypothetical protein
MELKDKDIEKLDFILERLIKNENTVSSNDLHIAGYYDEYNDDEDKINKDFNILKLVFKDLGIGRIISTKDGNLISYEDSLLRFKTNHNNFENYFSKQKKKELDNQLNQLKKNERQDLKDEIDRLNLSSLNHKEKVREQEDRIRDLTEKLTFINLVKGYKWYVGFLISIGIALGYLFSLLIA